uniref:Uncharacterized protein n=1 Tax=Onchocerca volvulus TaxID=6282 RepID=A0A8R1TRV8_ONCVO
MSKITLQQTRTWLARTNRHIIDRRLMRAFAATSTSDLCSILGKRTQCRKDDMAIFPRMDAETTVYVVNNKQFSKIISVLVVDDWYACSGSSHCVL